MQYPEDTYLFITSIDFGDLDSLGKGNIEFRPQPGIRINYKLFTYKENESGRKEKIVVGAGSFSYPMYNEHVIFDQNETELNEMFKENIQDIIIGSELILSKNLAAKFKSILEQE